MCRAWFPVPTSSSALDRPDAYLEKAYSPMIDNIQLRTGFIEFSAALSSLRHHNLFQHQYFCNGSVKFSCVYKSKECSEHDLQKLLISPPHGWRSFSLFRVDLSLLGHSPPHVMTCSILGQRSSAGYLNRIVSPWNCDELEIVNQTYAWSPIWLTSLRFWPFVSEAHMVSLS